MLNIQNHRQIIQFNNNNKKKKEKWSENRLFFKEDMEKAMAPHSSTLAWKIPWMEEPGRL